MWSVGRGGNNRSPHIPSRQMFQIQFYFFPPQQDIFMTVPLWLSGQPPLYGNWLYNKPDAKPAVDLSHPDFTLVHAASVRCFQLFMYRQHLEAFFMFFSGPDHGYLLIVRLLSNCFQSPQTFLAPIKCCGGIYLRIHHKSRPGSCTAHPLQLLATTMLWFFFNGDHFLHLRTASV